MRKFDGELRRLDFKVELFDIEGCPFDSPEIKGGIAVYVPKGGSLKITPMEAEYVIYGIRDVLEQWIKPKFNK